MFGLDSFSTAIVAVIALAAIVALGCLFSLAAERRRRRRESIFNRVATDRIEGQVVASYRPRRTVDPTIVERAIAPTVQESRFDMRSNGGAF